MHVDMAFPKVLLPFQVLSSPCYLTSGKRTAAQVQLKRASSCSAMPSSVLLVLWVYSDSYSVAESLRQYMIYLHRGTRAPFFRTFKILKHSLLQITYMISDFPGMKLVHWICSEQVTLLSLVFLEDLQRERGIWNLRTALVETWTVEKSWTCFSEFLCVMLPTWLCWNSKLRPPQGLVTACYKGKGKLNHNTGEQKNSKKKPI